MPAGCVLPVAALLLYAGTARAQEVPACAPPVARVVSVQGVVEIQRAGQPAWHHVNRLDTPLCQGDRLQTGAQSRAALFIYPESLVRLDQNSVLGLTLTQDETIVEFFESGAAPPAALGNACGAGYFISRFPRKFRVRTPLLNAAVEGTEFLVGLRCDAAELSVIEGKVAAETADTTAALAVSGGQTVAAQPGLPPEVQVLVKPVDAVQWALYYPPLSAQEAPPAQACEQLDGDEQARCLVARAETALRAGRADAALLDTEQLLALQPGNGEALALRAVVHVAKGDKEQALFAARRAVEQAPTSARAWLALSYAQQAVYELEQALESAGRAAALAPGQALPRTRLAELNLSLDRTKQAAAQAREAIALAPGESRGHMVAGFVALTQLDTRSAREHFLAAIERDPTEPLARLGLGLATIRQGDLRSGREHIEIAVALDPANALVRSYMGKAYYEENVEPRDALAATQFDLARSFDRRDPTPWLYDAVLEQSQNRPVQALEGLERSIELNDNRAVYRSRLLLDDDLAARSVGLAQVYRSLGLESRAVAEASRSLALDPASSSAHRFLFESYSSLPRHEVAQVSELLQSQLLQPLTLNAVPPRLSQSDLFTLQDGAPGDPSFNEYTSLFVRDGARALLNLHGGTHGTFADDLVVSALKDRMAVSAGQFHYETDGWRTNSEYQDDLYNVFGQIALSDTTGIQAEFRTRSLEHGDITLRRTQPDVRPNFHRSLDQDTARLGLRHAFGPGIELLGSVIYQDRHEKQGDQTTAVTVLPFPLPPITTTTRTDTDRSERGTSSELQLLWQRPALSGVLGGGYADTDGTLTTVTTVQTSLFPAPVVGTIRSDPGVIQKNVYAYGSVHLHPALDLTLGVSHDWYRDFTIKRDEWNPKVGLVWSPSPSTRVRAATFRTVKRALIADQTIEPTQVAGFNQFFDDANGTKAERIGLGIDQRLSRRLFAGLELSERRLDWPRRIGNMTLEEDQRERLYRAYLTFMPVPKVALNAQVVVDELDIDPVDLTDLTRPAGVTTVRAPLHARFFPNERWSYFVKLEGVWQEVETESVFAPRASSDEEFWLLDLGVSLRLPQRRGTISLQLTNVLDEDFLYQDTNFRSVTPRLPEFLPGMGVFAKLNLVIR